MTLVWKYTLPIEEGWFTIDMPAGAEVLTVQLQDGFPRLWCRVPSASAPTQPKRFRWVPTGFADDECPDRARYIATVQQGPLVFHLFESAP